MTDTSLTLWHNPRCSKSRQTLALLEEKGLTPDVRLYLDESPSAAEISAVLQKLSLSDPRDLMRTKEADYKDQGLADKNGDTLIDAMVNTPKLIERPIVITATKAAIGRPPESVLDIL